MTRLTPDEQLKLGRRHPAPPGHQDLSKRALGPLLHDAVGGPADLFAEVRNLFELRGIVRFARSRDVPLFLIGRGSDLVISDAGIGGLVVVVRAAGLRVEGEQLHAEAGVQMAKLATTGKQHGLTGLEFGLAIPGSVGGAVWANAGAHGADVEGVLSAGPRGRRGRRGAHLASC